MTTQPSDYPTYSTVSSLEKSYQSNVTPAVKVLAALYLANSIRNPPTSSEADSAENVVLDWLDRLLDIAKIIFLMPHFNTVNDDNINVFEGTINRLKSDVTTLRNSAPQGNLESRIIARTDNVDVTASRLLLRLQWSMDWVKSHLQSPPPSAATKKIWVSRLDAKTCSVACRRMHGVSVPVNESFTAAAADQGVPSSLLYGALWGPPIHPNCRCHLVYV